MQLFVEHNTPGEKGFHERKLKDTTQKKETLFTVTTENDEKH